MTKNIYFFRHGETAANLELKLMGGRSDSPLTEKGIAQAKQLAKVVQTLPLDVLFVSSNTRAQETAALLNATKSLPAVITPEIKEQDFGLMTGVYLKDIPAEVDAAYRDDPYHFHHQEGESIDDVKIRVGKFLDQLAKDSSYQNIGIVTHENVIRAAIAYMRNIDREVLLMKIPHCSLTHYFLDNSLTYHAITIGRTY